MAVITLDHDQKKKNSKNSTIFFSYNFFSKIFFSFFCEIASLVSTTYILLLKIGRAVLKKNHFLSNFAFFACFCDNLVRKTV